MTALVRLMTITQNDSGKYTRTKPMIFVQVLSYILFIEARPMNGPR